MSHKKEDPDELLTVSTFDDLAEALVAKSKLDAEGIPCFLPDDKSASIMGSVGALRGNRLQVKRSDLERARSALNE